MPMLSIIPAAAVSDPMLTDTQVRVLCAIGTFTNRLGGNVWASIATLAKASNLSPRSVQRALPALLANDYLRRIERPGRTTIYEVVLEPSARQTVAVPEPETTSERPIKAKKTAAAAAAIMQEIVTIWHTYPPRPEPYAFVPVRKAIVETLTEDGVTIDQLVHAVQRYARHCQATGVEAKYVKGLVGFFRDGIWRTYSTVTVHGRTREEWARSGQDVSEFDRLAALHSPTEMAS